MRFASSRSHSPPDEPCCKLTERVGDFLTGDGLIKLMGLIDEFFSAMEAVVSVYEDKTVLEHRLQSSNSLHLAKDRET